MTLPLWSPGTSASGPERRDEGPRRLSLVRLAGEIARSLSAIGRVVVEGEVHRPQVSKAGWTYFTLRDRAAQVPVVCPARVAKRCRAHDGQRATVVGALTWDNNRGQLALEAEEVTPVGEGAVAAMIAETRARLAAEGLLDRPRRPLPLLPRVIGVLCGQDAAVEKDIESVVTARFPHYPLAVEETLVGGPGAAPAITAALARLASRPGVDVIILARGGGDATQLLPWSDEELCRAVAACPVPVVSAIGHEGDRPLCDEVADVRCGTPSIAAQLVVPERRQLEQQLAELMDRARSALLRSWGQRREALQRVAVEQALASGLERARAQAQRALERLSWAHPAPLLAERRRLLGRCDWRAPMRSRLAASRDHLVGLRHQADALSPEHVIRRGFAVVRLMDGSVVRNPSQAAPGELLELTVAEGRLLARAEGGQ
ncbi:MAG: exodeoxyribonuclease VII large subunit [Acidimicrobiales bacterium]